MMYQYFALILSMGIACNLFAADRVTRPSPTPSPSANPSPMPSGSPKPLPSPTSFWKTESGTVLRPILHSVGVKGQVSVLKNLPALSRWIWKGTPEVPMIRTWVTLAEGASVESAKTSTPGSSIVEDSKKDEFLPSGFKVIKGRTVVFDSASPEAHIEVTLLAAKGKPNEVLSLVQQVPAAGLQLSHPSCENLGMRVSPIIKSDQFHYIAARCEPRNGATGVTILVSSDLQPKGFTAGKEMLPPFKTNPNEKTPRPVGKIAATPKNAQAPLQWTLYSAQPQDVAEKRFNAGFNLGFTYLNYLEPSQGIHISGLNLTPKLNFSYALIPSRLVADVGGFFTLLPLYQNPSDLPKPRFYGINARLGYLISSKSMTWGIHAGWYFWGMLVPNKSYGISSATGPQIFLSARSNSKRTNFVYLKYAPLSSSLLSDREVAIGGQIGLGASLWQRPLGLSLDLSHFAYETVDMLNSVNLATVSLGLSMPFTKP